ncbi:MAG TPA: thiamine-phosphate kinase, partial [Chromatiales bacterium]|nr:thiamine-phosphate kinase [Chromatiales bacterium]
MASWIVSPPACAPRKSVPAGTGSSPAAGRRSSSHVMPLSEFEIIRRYFDHRSPSAAEVIKGIGDDAALLGARPGADLVIAIDTLVEAVHFPPETLADDIGYKALAVNLSDLAAMGAEAAWFTLALTLPRPDVFWLADFSRGLFELADEAGVRLVGGDTTRGPLTVTVQAGGYVPRGQALLREGARPGDLIYVTGTLGDAALALALWRQDSGRVAANHPGLWARLNRPPARWREGQALRGLARCAIDISDGLLADLGHLLEGGDIGARVRLDAIPVSDAAREVLERHPDWQPLLWQGGDDYELCFCVAPDRQA